MAGVKGKSGGAREGAGRKPKQAAVVADPNMDPLAFLQGVMTGTIEATALQVRAAIAHAQYLHPKAGDGGKKDGEDKAAKAAGRGKFATAPGPRLATANGKPVTGAA